MQARSAGMGSQAAPFRLQLSWSPESLPGAARILAVPGRDKNAESLSTEADEIPVRAAAGVMIRQGESSRAVNQFDRLPQSPGGGSGIDLPRPSQQPRAEHGGQAACRKQEVLLLSRFN